MRKTKIISYLLIIVAVLMVSVGLRLQEKVSIKSNDDLTFYEVNTNNITASENVLSKNDMLQYRVDNSSITESVMETAPASVLVPPRIEVFDGLTMEELAAKLDKNLGNDIMGGKGYFIASNCIEKGVNPYIATAIILHETGCGTKCSNLARYCYNVSGQKGRPGCNGGSFKKFDSLDEGIMGLINNLYKNYYSVGLDTVEKIASKYAEGNTWAGKINYFVNKIKNS
ncbi:MAG: glucosaminidase domain-containing protein [Tenericutes bacterium]|nr:glucosaminidase domain-containing protein [Mycoplasmatota bacterium]